MSASRKTVWPRGVPESISEPLKISPRHVYVAKFNAGEVEVSQVKPTQVTASKNVPQAVKLGLHDDARAWPADAHASRQRDVVRQAAFVVPDVGCV